jgi:hypothetical protein
MKTALKKHQSEETASVKYGRKATSWFKWRLLFGLVGTLALLAGTAPGAINDNAPAIRIWVDDYAHVSPAILAGAQREAARILARAALRTEWVDCSVKSRSKADPCNEPLQPTEIVLHLIPKSKNNTYPDSVFGVAVIPLVVSVFVNRVVQRAQKDNAEFEIPLILGNVIAHEIGHLLLGLNSHSGSGIMQKRWERHQMRQALTGNLLFTSEQGTLMRAEVRKRAHFGEPQQTARAPVLDGGNLR